MYLRIFVLKIIYFLIKYHHQQTLQQLNVKQLMKKANSMTKDDKRESILTWQLVALLQGLESSQFLAELDSKLSSPWNLGVYFVWLGFHHASSLVVFVCCAIFRCPPFIDKFYSFTRAFVHSVKLIYLVTHRTLRLEIFLGTNIVQLDIS